MLEEAGELENLENIEDYPYISPALTGSMQTVRIGNVEVSSDNESLKKVALVALSLYQAGLGVEADPYEVKSKNLIDSKREEIKEILKVDLGIFAGKERQD